MSTSPTLSDEDLLKKHQQGDPQAFRALVERYTTPIYNLAYRLLNDRMEAENITQETFLRTITSLNRVRLDKPIKPYLFRIAVNACRDYARKKHPILFTEWSASVNDNFESASEPLVDDAPEPWEQLAEQELTRQLQFALAKLPAHYRAVILLRYVEELSYDQIAQALDLPVNTVRTHLRRAKQRLRSAITKIPT